MGLNSKVPANTNQVKNLLSTGVISGCIVSTSDITATTADVTVSAGVIRYMDNHTDAELPSFSEFNFPESTLQDVVITFGAKIIIDATQTLISEAFSGTDSPTQRRTRIEVSVISPTGVPLRALANIGFDTAGLLKDVAEALGIVNKGGFRVEANGVNLQLDVGAGIEFSPFFGNYETSKLDPFNESMPARTAITFFETWQDVSQPLGFAIRFGRTSLSPGVYDDGTANGDANPQGTVSTNQAQILRLYESDGNFGILCGQTKYNSISSAVDALLTEQFVQSPFFVQTAFRCFIVIRGAAADLTDPSDALIFQPSSAFTGVPAV